MTVRACIATLSVALVLTACGGGGGGEVLPPEESPVTPPPTTGPTDPAANKDPVANAGPDKTTVEEQDVEIDGSRTSDAENDPISYRWEIVSAPPGSTVTVVATSPTFVFRPDLPGQYELKLTADDGRGESSDTMRVTADALARIASGEQRTFSITAASPAGSDQLDLSLRTSEHYAGEPVTYIPSSNVAWLTLPASVATAAAGATTPVRLTLNPVEVGRLANGEYEARVTLRPVGGWEEVTADVSLDLRLPIVRSVIPYVAYAGSTSRVTLYGEHLSEADGRSVIVNGIEAPGIAASGDARATVELPALSAGTFTVRIKNTLDIQREMARVIVRAPPDHADADVPLPALIHYAEYDAERDSLYALFRSTPVPGAVSYLARRIHRIGGAWQVDPIPVSGQPLALSLTADGTRLIVAAEGCAVHELDPATLATLSSATKPSCDPLSERLGGVVALADGRILLVDDHADSNVWEYPGFAATDILPQAIHAFAVVNYDRNRVLWAELPEGVREWRAWYYEIGGSAQSWRGQPGYWRHILAVSGDGSRTVHRADVYDQNLRFIGALTGLQNPFIVAPGVDRRGTRAVVLDDHGERLVINDLTGSGPFYPAIAAIALPGDVTDSSIVLVAPTGAAAFVFAGSRSVRFFGAVDTFTLFVRGLP